MSWHHGAEEYSGQPHPAARSWQFTVAVSILLVAASLLLAHYLFAAHTCVLFGALAVSTIPLLYIALKKPILLLALLIAQDPLISLLALFGYSGFFLSTPPLLLVVATVLWRASVGRQLLFVPRQAVLVLLFFCSLCVCSLFMQFPGPLFSAGIPEGARGYFQLSLYMRIILLYFAVLQTVSTERHLRILVWAMVVPTVLSCLGGLFLWYWSESAVLAWVGMDGIRSLNPNHVTRMAGLGRSCANQFAAGVVASLLVVLFTAIQSRSRLRAVLLFALAPLMVIAVAASESRGALIAIGIASLVFACVYARREYLKRFLLMLTVATVLVIPAIPKTYVRRLSHFTLQGIATDLSLRRRAAMHELGLECYLRSPLVGLGPANFDVRYNKEMPRHSLNSVGRPMRMHNTVLAFLLDSGALGGLAMVVVTALMFAEFRRAQVLNESLGAQSPWPIALMMAALGYLVCQLFLCGVNSELLWVFLALGPCTRRIMVTARERSEWLHDGPEYRDCTPVSLHGRSGGRPIHRFAHP